MGFLRKEHQEFAAQEMRELGCPEHIIESVPDIPEGEHDRHRFAHAVMCERNALYREDRNELNLLLSTAILIAIDREAKDRGMTPEDFPRSHKFMSAIVAANAGKPHAPQRIVH